MKSKILLVAFIVCTHLLVAQEFLIGPASNVNIFGNLVVRQALVKSSATPTAAQTVLIPAATTLYAATTDSVGRVKDHNAPPAFYELNRDGYVYVYPPNGIYNFEAIEISFEYYSVGTGDSLIIMNDMDGVLMRFGKDNPPSGSYTFNETGLIFIFRTNSDLGLGTGFSIIWRRLYNSNSNVQPAFQPGNSFVFNRVNGSVSSGKMHFSPQGKYSSRMGYENKATGDYSQAFGSYSVATGTASFAAGMNSFATGNYAVAMGTGRANAVGSVSLGYNTAATGPYATALGRDTYAAGAYSLAQGYYTMASGDYSVATGINTVTHSYASFVLGRYNYVAPANGSAWSSGDPEIIVGNGTSNTVRSNILEFYKDGNLFIRGAVYEGSDKKLKRDIKPVNNSLQKLSRLKGYNYYWKEENLGNKLQTGVMAQEVEEAFPELIMQNLKGDLAVNYTGLIPHLIEAIRELKQQVDELKTESRQADIAICLCSNEQPDKLAAFPNPASNQMTVTIATETVGKGLLKLIDGSGKTVKQINISIQKGKNTFSVSLPGLAAGHYELTAEWGNGMKKQVSIVKQ